MLDFNIRLAISLVLLAGWLIVNYVLKVKNIKKHQCIEILECIEPSVPILVTMKDFNIFKKRGEAFIASYGAYVKTEQRYERVFFV